MNQSQEVYHNGTKLLFTKANEICAWRIKSFSSKEPETLDWIDSMENNSIIWDIGANIGLYSCYAAKKVKNSKVFAFEPSVFNLEILARNIHLNDLSNQINMVPLAVTEKLGFENLNSSFDDWGSALSTFGHNYTHDGKNIEINFKTSQLGISIEDAVKVLKIPQPDYIKIDVDGIEHLILKGGKNILSNTKSVLVEINDDFELQKNNSEKYLRESGLTFKEKLHASFYDNTNLKSCYNQIWIKS